MGREYVLIVSIKQKFFNLNDRPLKTHMMPEEKLKRCEKKKEKSGMGFSQVKSYCEFILT